MKRIKVKVVREVVAVVDFSETVKSPDEIVTEVKQLNLIPEHNCVRIDMTKLEISFICIKNAYEVA